MNQLSRVCTYKNHKDQNIEYVCVDPQCKQTRFLCYMCFQEGIHKHQNNGKSVCNYGQFNDYFAKIKASKRSNDAFSYTIVKDIGQILLHFKTLISEIWQKVFMSINQKQLQEYENRIKQGFYYIDIEFLQSIIGLQQNNQKQEIFDITQKYSNMLIQNISALQEWSKSQLIPKQQQIQQQVQQQDPQIQKIKSVSYDVRKIHETEQDNVIITASISNNLKYIIASVKDKLHIWDYKSFELIQTINFCIELRSIGFCKFTDDSKIIYVALGSKLYNLQERKSFDWNFLEFINIESSILNMIITNKHILTVSIGNLCQFDIQLGKKTFSIQAHDGVKIKGLDYDKTLNMIATGADDKSIKIWHGTQGFKILEKKQAHWGYGKQQLVSCDSKGYLIIWQIDPEKEQLFLLNSIKDSSDIFNFSLVLKEEYILLVCKEFVKIHSINGELIKQFNHYLQSPRRFSTVQIETTKAIVLIGEKQIRICKQI